MKRREGIILIEDFLNWIIPFLQTTNHESAFLECAAIKP